MKEKSKSRLLIVAVAIFFALSCELVPPVCGCSEPLPPPGTMEGYFQLDRRWSSTTAKAVISDGRITITGQDQSTIQFSIEASESGSYRFSNATGTNIALFAPASEDTNSSLYASAYSNLEVSGGVDIMTIDTKKKTITGRFECVVARPTDEAININGAFNEIPYVEIPVNAFSGERNGITFSPVIIGGRYEDGQIIAHFAQTNGEMAKLVFMQFQPEGAYTLGASNGRYITTTGEYYETDSGSLTITEHDMVLRKISGAFNFSAHASVTEGESVDVNATSFTVYY